MQGITKVIGLLLAAGLCAGAILGPSAPVFGGPAFWLPPDFGGNNPHRAVAVGDSITAGALGDGDLVSRPYPATLQALLAPQDPFFTVLNRGLGGESTDGGLSRLPGVLAADRPAFVLIMEGTNDASHEVDPAPIVANLRAMVRLAKANSSIPLIGAIPPNFRDSSETRAIIATVNATLRAVAAQEDIRFVDTFSALNDPGLFARDQFHPNQQGYDVLAAAWQPALSDAIQASRAPLGGVFVAGGHFGGSSGQPQVLTGSGPGVTPQVGRFRADNTAAAPTFMPYVAEFMGGVRVAACDLNRDGVDDVITGTGFGGGPHVRAFDGATGVELASFFAFGPEFSGGVFVACGDLDGSGIPTIIVGAGRGGGPRVTAFRYEPSQPAKVVPFGVNFYAYAPSFTGGVAVAVADLVGDGQGSAIITGAGPGGGPHVRAFRLKPGAPGGVDDLGIGFFAYAPSFTGGVFVAGGDLGEPDAAGRTRAELITGAGPGGGPHVRIFRRETDGTLTERAGFFAYDPAFPGGVTVGVVGHQVVTGAGPGGGPHVRSFTGDGVPASINLFAYPY